MASRPLKSQQSQLRLTHQQELTGGGTAVTAELVNGLAGALEATGCLVDGVRDDQWFLPSPCPDWNVGDLVNHVVSGNRLFAGIVRGDRPGPPAGGGGAPASGQPGRDLPGAYREAASELVAAFSRPGVMEERFTVPFGMVPGSVALHLRITELLVHGWDLARATGQPARFPDGLAEQELAFSRAALAAIPPGRTPFAPPQPAAADAPAIDQLAALLGRAVAPAADGGPTG
jgi:uncharacterized protein (TIGR03086 family)